MIRKLLLLTLLLVAFCFLILGSQPPNVQANPPVEAPTTEFVEKLNQRGGRVLAVFENPSLLVVSRNKLTEIYERSNPAQPMLISRILDFMGYALADNMVYGTWGYEYPWEVWDLRQPATPTLVGRFEPEGDLVASSDTLLVFRNGSIEEGGLVIYQMVPGALPQRVGVWNENKRVWWAEFVDERLYAGIVSCDITCNPPAPLEIVDLSDPTQPIAIGQGTSEMSDWRFHRDIEGNYLYQAQRDYGAGATLRISEIIRDPAQVIPISTIGLGGFIPESLVVYENWLYLMNGSEGTKIFDVSNPQAPIEITTVPELVAGTIYGKTLYGIEPLDVSLLGETTYLPIYSLATPDAPTLVNTIFHPAGEWMFRGSNNLIYLIDQSLYSPYIFYLHTVDITLPDAPQLLRTDVLDNHVDSGSNGYQPFEFHMVNGTYLYAARNTINGQNDGVDIFRLPQDANTPPTLVRILDVPVFLTAAVENAFLVQDVSWEREMDIYDTSDPENPLLVSQLTIEHDIIREINTDGDFAYVWERSTPYEDREMFILDISNPAKPFVAGRFDGDFLFPSEHAFTVANGYMYYRYVLDSRVNGLNVADLRDPANPTIATYPIYSEPITAPYFQTDGHRLYISDQHCGTQIRIYTLENPAEPQFASRLHRNRDCSYFSAPLLPYGEQFFLADDYFGLRTYGFVERETLFLPSLYRHPSP